MEYLQTFHTKLNSIFRCPICKSKFEIDNSGKSLLCTGERKHCFDIAAKGYVNLLCGHGNSGDSKEAVRSRKTFLEKGFYAAFANEICKIINDVQIKSGKDTLTVIDAGCGEGYYTNLVAQNCNALTIGFDLSKFGIESAAAYAKKNEIKNAFYSVAGIFDMPINDHKADVIINLFAPCAEEEFLRVLDKDGILIVAGAGENHLFGMKKIIYDNPYKNEKRNDLPINMTHIDSRTVKFTIELPCLEDRKNLFAMTPYFYRTSKIDSEKLEKVGALTTEVEFDIEIYKA